MQVAGRSRRRLVEAQVDHRGQTAGQSSDVCEDGRSGRETLDVGPEAGHAISFVGQQDSLGPRSPSAPAGRGPPPPVRQRTVSVVLGDSAKPGELIAAAYGPDVESCLPDALTR